MKYLKITSELALTIQLLENAEAGIFVNALIDYASGVKGIDPRDYSEYLERALKYWFAHIDDITITEV